MPSEENHAFFRRSSRGLMNKTSKVHRRSFLESLSGLQYIARRHRAAGSPLTLCSLRSSSFHARSERARESSPSTTGNLANWFAAAVCLAVASTPNHILKRQLRDAVRLLGGLVTASGSKAPTARAGTLLAPTAAAAQAAELRSSASHALSRAMSGEHGYDYDLVVIGGGSGGLVRPRSPAPPLIFI